LECWNNNLLVNHRLSTIWNVIENEFLVSNSAADIRAGEFIIFLDKKLAVSIADTENVSG